MNNSIIFEIKHNKSFVKIEIKDNKVICDDIQIKQDIQTKLNKIKRNISFVLFYVSKYDYGIEKKDEYWKTIQHLEKSILPIYRKEEDLDGYIKWLEENFNNNKIAVYETNKFTKRQTVFKDAEECKASVKWENTNPKYESFNQIFYHAGDNYDLERYGYIYIRTLYEKPKQKPLNSDLFKDVPIWNNFETSFETIKNTMDYMFNKMKKGILVGIKNNKLVIFLPFSKYDYLNDNFTELYFDDQDKKDLENYKKNPTKELKRKLENTVKKYMYKYKLNMNNIYFDREKWVANDCFFRNENYEGDKSEAAYEDFIKQVCENREISDCIFILNLRDHPMLHKELKDSYTNLVDKELPEKYKHTKWTPILSQGGSKDNADICLVTTDDWSRISKNYYPDDCTNGYMQEVEIYPWEDKIEQAVFRGSATGCNMDESNIRIKAANLSKEYPEYIDAGITSLNRKIKKNIGKPLSVIDPQVIKNRTGFMKLDEKKKYKYILNLEGHVSAFRLGFEFSLGSVILLPESKYYLWFSFLLKPYEHYIPIKSDLSDLIEKIKWCKESDKECKRIAENGVKFYNKYLTREGVFDYMQTILNKTSLKTLSLKFYDKKIGIITIFRNNQDNTRLIQKRIFTYWMNKMLSQICNYEIIIVEQSEKYAFNIGKLKNIGFEYLNKNSKEPIYNYIFCDIDSIPDSELVKYYFKQTDSLNSLASEGTRYTQVDKRKPFVGAMISCSEKVFKDINGYPNNFYGWEGEDTNLLLRLSDLKLPIYVNKKGSIIDTEEVGNKQKDLRTKIDELNTNKERESQVYEKNMNFMNYKENGLSNLNYTVLYENKFKYENNKNYHIIVDLELEQDKIKYPHDYEFKDMYDKKSYKEYINPKIYSIKKIEF